MSNTLTFDIKDLESRASKIEKSDDGPNKEQLKALKDFLNKPRNEHDKIRAQSRTYYDDCALRALLIGDRTRVDIDSNCNPPGLISVDRNHRCKA